MTIWNGESIKRFTLYPPRKPIENPLFIEDLYGDEEVVQPILIVEESEGFKDPTEENLLNIFITNLDCIQYPRMASFHHVLSANFQENCDPSSLSSFSKSKLTINAILESYSTPIEIS